MYRQPPVKRTNRIEITQQEIREAIAKYVKSRYAEMPFAYDDVENVQASDVDLSVHTTVDGDHVDHTVTAKIEIVTDF